MLECEYFSITGKKTFMTSYKGKSFQKILNFFPYDSFRFVYCMVLQIVLLLCAYKSLDETQIKISFLYAMICYTKWNRYSSYKDSKDDFGLLLDLDVLENAFDNEFNKNNIQIYFNCSPQSLFEQIREKLKITK